MAMQYRGSVLVLDDGDGRAEDMAERVHGVFPNVMRMATQGQGRGLVRVDERHLDIKTLVDKMREHEAYWALISKERDPVVVISDYVSAARKHLTDDFPVFVLVATTPGRRYGRIAVVTDVRAPVTTGALALSGVGMAIHCGASLDVILLGADPQRPPSAWPEVEQVLEIRAGAQYLEQALDKAREVGLQINWVPVAESSNRDQAVLDAVREGDYDLVLDDLRPIDVGSRFGRLKRVERQLVAGGNVDTAYRLLRDAPCDVGIVVDAVNMNLVSGSALAVGAVAALSLGMVGAAAPPAPTGSSGAATMVAAVEAPLTPAEQAVSAADSAVATAEAVAAPAPIVGIPAPSMAELPAELSQEQYASYQGSYAQEQAVMAAEQAKLADLQAQQAAADTALALAQSDLALERSDVTSAKATVDSAQDRAEYSQQGKDNLTPADEARAEGSLNAAERDLQRQQSDVEQAEEDLAAARDAAAVAAAATGAQQSVVDAEAANMAAWDGFMVEADARTDRVVSPVPGYGISTRYGVAGPYWSSGYHTGVDYAAPSGAPVVAAANGTVVETGWNGAYGNQVKIQHEDGTYTTYAHLRSINVSVGESVGAGDQIGTIGSTGNSTGPHLHFELLNAGGGFENPETWLAANGAA